MEFTYFKSTGVIFDKHGGYDGDDGYYFNYEVDNERIKTEISYFVLYEYFDKSVFHNMQEYQIKLMVKAVENFIDDHIDWDIMFENYKDKLQEIFEEEAIACEDERYD